MVYIEMENIINRIDELLGEGKKSNKRAGINQFVRPLISRFRSTNNIDEKMNVLFAMTILAVSVSPLLNPNEAKTLMSMSHKVSKS